MLGLVENPEDQFSHNEAHIVKQWLTSVFIVVVFISATKHGTHYANTPMQYTAIFHSFENVNFHMIVFKYFSYFSSKQ